MKHIKCIVAGDSNVDKTSLVVQYSTQARLVGYIPVVNDNYSCNTLFEDKPINLQLWKVDGNDPKQLRSLSYPQTDVFIIVFSLVNPQSLENVEQIWVPEIKENCPNTAYILAGSRSKNRDEFPQHEDEFSAKCWSPVSKEKGIEMMKKVKALDYIEFSVENNKQVDQVFESAMRCVIHPKEEKKEKPEKPKKRFFWQKSKK